MLPTVPPDGLLDGPFDRWSGASREPLPDDPRRDLVEVAVDAPAGPGPRTYTYLVPEGLGDLAAGEPVLVPFGRGGRQAIGVIIGPGVTPASGELRPIAARVRSDGPLLPPLAMAFAGVLADRYLAPLAMVIRAMLPPGMLERLELVAEVTPAGETRLGAESPGLAIADVDLLDELAGRSRPVRELATPEGRVSLLRRLRALAADGLVDLTWTLVGAAVGPRFERRLWLTAAGREAAATLRTGGRIAGRQPGPRQREALDAIHGAEAGGTATDRNAVDRPAGSGAIDPTDPPAASAPPATADDGLAAAPLAEQFGAGALAGLVRRGLLRAEVRERPRRPLAGRPPGLRGARPPAPCSPRRRLPSSSSGRPSTPGTRRRSCSTVSPAVARRRSTSRDWWRVWPPDGGRSCWSRRSPSPRRSWTGCGRSCRPGGRPPFGPWRRRARGNGGASVPGTPTSWSARGPRCWPRSMTWA